MKRDRDRDRETDRQIDRQTETKTETDRQTDRQTFTVEIVHIYSIHAIKINCHMLCNDIGLVS